MALFNLRAGGARKSVVSVNQLKETLARSEEQIFNTDVATKYIGLESDVNMDSMVQSSLEGHFGGIVDNLRSDFECGEVGLESASRAAMMLGDLDGLSRKLKEVGLESFSKVSLGKFRAETIAANAMVAEKRTILDTIFPIVEVGANYGGIELNLTRFVQVRNTVNPGTGEVMDFQRRHLIEGYRNVDALVAHGNKLFPVVVTGKNTDMFIDPALLPYAKVPGSEEVFTSALAPLTQEVNILGLSRIPGQDASSRHTYNDRIEEGGRVDTLFVQVTGNEDAKVLLPISLATHNSAQFIKGANVGESNDVQSQVDTKELTVNLSSTVAQSVPALKALADAGYARVTFGMNLVHKLNLHNGNLSQLASSVAVTGVFKNGDETNFLADAGVAPEVAKLTPVFAGVQFALTLSSKTVRLEGTRVDDQTIPFTFQVASKSPFTGDKAIDESDVQSLLETMTASMVIERESAAVRYLLEQIDVLNAQYGDNDVEVNPQGNSMCGLTYLHRPYVRVEELKLEDIVDTIKSSERFGDIQAAIMHLLADRAADAVTKTAYVEAKRLYTNDANAKAEFAILTPRDIGRYIYTEGDDRSFGALEDIEKKPTIITSALTALEDTVIMVPMSTAEAGTFDPFAFGNTLVHPALVYDVEITADGGVKRHLQLQPFYEFTTNAPIVYKLKVAGLGEFLRSKATYLTKEA